MFNAFWAIDFENLYSTFFDVFGIRINRQSRKDWGYEEKTIVEALFNSFLFSLVHFLPRLLILEKKFRGKVFRLVKINAYADYTRLIQYPKGLFKNSLENLFTILSNNGISPIQSFQKAKVTKTMTDISLVLDVVSLVNKNETKLDVFILFAQDADFLPLVEWLLVNTRLYIVITHFHGRISRLYTYHNFAGSRFMLLPLNWVKIQAWNMLLEKDPFLGKYNTLQKVKILREIVQANYWVSENLKRILESQEHEKFHLSQKTKMLVSEILQLREPISP